MSNKKSMPDDRRLIEDFLPLDDINAATTKEKKHPKHFVTLVHYWPARRPITACRAAVYSALVPADQFQPPNGDANKQFSLGRANAAKFIKRLCMYPGDPKVIAEAEQHIMEAHAERLSRETGKKVTADDIIAGRAPRPRVLDMFAGGGAIPLEALRLGCDAQAGEYNPVAHIIELCTLVYPQRYGLDLADDVRRWGASVLKQLKADLGCLYPGLLVKGTREVLTQAELFGANLEEFHNKQQPAAYIWVRTVPCKKPGCNAEVPLSQRVWLRKKGGVIAAVPRFDKKLGRIVWRIMSGNEPSDVNADNLDQTGAGQATCLACPTPVSADYVKECAVSGRMGESLAAVVFNAGRSKLYVSPEQLASPVPAARVRDALLRLSESSPGGLPDEKLRGKLEDQLPNYGYESFDQLFTDRQKVVLQACSSAITRVHSEARCAGVAEDRAHAIVAFLAMAFGRLLNSFNKFCRWAGKDQCTLPAIGDRQALKMVYDFPEINPFAETAGCLEFALSNEIYCIENLAKTGLPATAFRGSSERLGFEDSSVDAVITDPPYYGSIFYSDLSAFFYVWLKRMLGGVYPEHFAAPLPPIRREAVAEPSVFGGDTQKADKHYTGVIEAALREAGRVLKPGAPLVCVYAHKTTEGWSSLISALSKAGLMVTEAWPLQTEARGRSNAQGTAALSDSIFFAARRRVNHTIGSYERDVLPDLRNTSEQRVRDLWAGGHGLGGADLLMAAIGAGLRVYTQYPAVTYENGDSVPAARFIEEVEGIVLDQMLEHVFRLKAGGVSAVDAPTRFAVLWRFTYGNAEIDAGDAIVFANGTHVELDGQHSLTTGTRPMLEKKKGKYRMRDFSERGDDDDLGMAGEDGQSAPLVDVLHRVMWLMENKPGRLATYLREAKPNLEQLRLVAQALAGPALRGGELADVSPSAEQAALAKLTANWRSIVEEGVLSKPERTARKERQEHFEY